MGNGMAKDNWKGSGKLELPLMREESVFIISWKEGCPSGKWLVRNEAGNRELINWKTDFRFLCVLLLLEGLSSANSVYLEMPTLPRKFPEFQTSKFG